MSTSRHAAQVVADTSARGASAAIDGSKHAAQVVADASSRGAAATIEGTRHAAQIVAETSIRGISLATETGRRAMNYGRRSAADLLAVSQGVLATSLAGDLNSMLSSLSDGPATIYDKAMDAKYLATSIGGGSHRMFDGGHTLAGAFEAVRGASPDDTVLQEAYGYMQGVFRDITTPAGLPLANWDKATYDQTANYLQSQFSIPKGWFYDINSFDAAEVLGAGAGVVGLFFCWNRADAEQFGRLAGSMGLAAALSANPLLLIVSVAALARAYQVARVEGSAPDALDGLLRGGATAGVSILAVSAVTALGGPAGMGLLIGLIAGILAAKAASRVSVTEIAKLVAQHAKASARFIRSIPALDRQPDTAPGIA